MTRWPIEPLTFSKKNPSRAIPRSTYIHPPSLAKIGQRTSEAIGNKQTDRQTDKQTNAARFIVWYCYVVWTDMSENKLFVIVIVKKPFVLHIWTLTGIIVNQIMFLKKTVLKFYVAKFFWILYIKRHYILKQTVRKRLNLIPDVQTATTSMYRTKFSVCVIS